MMSEPDGKQTAVKPQVLKGFRDYLPEQMLLRNRVIATIREVFERHGFEPLDSPALEYYEVLAGKAGENEKLMYNFEDQGGRRVGMRYDLTVPLARVVAMHQNELVLPFKRYHIGPVWRADKPQRGRFREFWQCDADIAGSASMLADAEVVSILSEVLTALRLPAFTIRISHRVLLERIAVAAGVENAEASAIYRSIDKLDKIGVSGVRAEMEANGIDIAVAEQTLDYVTRPGSPDELIAFLRVLLQDDEVGLQALGELEELFGLLPLYGVPARNYQFDLSLARGLDYYTGPVYEATVEQPKVGSVSGAGRYDRLIGTFLGRPVPATGISLGLERLIEVMQELELMPAERSIADAMVVVFPGEIAVSAALATDLREHGLKIDLSLLSNRSLGDQLKYADRRGIPYAVIAGADETARGEVSVKHLASGEQFSLPRTELARELLRLRGKPTG